MVDAVRSVRGSTVVFEDGTTAIEVDEIIHATGYNTTKGLGFMSEDLQVVDSDSDDLYLATQLPSNPRLFYISLGIFYFSFGGFEKRADYVASVISGETPLPSARDLSAWENVVDGYDEWVLPLVEEFYKKCENNCYQATFPHWTAPISNVVWELKLPVWVAEKMGKGRDEIEVSAISWC